MTDSNAIATTNACTLCTPLGAALAFRGVEGAVPFLHGSQGCATYMRRYLISHFREPVDIASSSLGEKQAVYGGGPNLKQGVLNVMKKYQPKLVGLASTCLTETIGDDLPMIVQEFRNEFGDLDLPELVRVSTPSYSGSHIDGWHGAIRAMVEQLCTEPADRSTGVAVFPGLVSCEDIRHLWDLLEAFGQDGTILPDISQSLDGPALEDYQSIPSGGTPIDSIKALGGSLVSLDLGRCAPAASGGRFLKDRFGVALHRLGLPIGLRETDALVQALADVTGRPVPERLQIERGRLIDAYIDGHKYLFGQRACVFGDDDMVVGLCSFLAEIGVEVVLAATGSRSRAFHQAVEAVTNGLTRTRPRVRTGVDYRDIAADMDELHPDLLIGPSKGYASAKDADIPLIRIGFPIHDRFGGQRTRHIGYSGALNLYDRIVNVVVARRQAENPVGYGYM